jgi:hypothetical protein
MQRALRAAVAWIVMNKLILATTMLLAAALVAFACNTSGLSEAPRATFAQLACLDVNGDNRVNDGDAANPSKLPDFNADRSRDDDDASFLRGVDIELDPARDKSVCNAKDKKSPEYLVAHGYLSPSDVSCDEPGDKAVLLLGIGGGAVNVREKDDAAGVRKAVDELMKAYDDEDVQTIGVIAGPAIGGAIRPHGAMEQWLTNAVRVYIERFPCLQAVVVGHSHGAVVADVIGAGLEDQYADRIHAVVDIDRVEELYIDGDTQSRPDRVFVFNIFLSHEPASTKEYNAPNAENWDASNVNAPSEGEEGGDPARPTHTTIDNSKDVHDRIVEEVVERPLQVRGQ